MNPIDEFLFFQKDLEEKEDQEDVQLAKKALAEARREGTVSLEEVAKELDIELSH